MIQEVILGETKPPMSAYSVTSIALEHRRSWTAAWIEERNGHASAGNPEGQSQIAIIRHDYGGIDPFEKEVFQEAGRYVDVRSLALRSWIH